MSLDDTDSAADVADEGDQGHRLQDLHLQSIISRSKSSPLISHPIPPYSARTKTVRWRLWLVRWRRLVRWRLWLVLRGW